MKVLFATVFLTACACALVFLPAFEAAESCVPSTMVCTPNSTAMPCCLPSKCIKPTPTAPATCVGNGVVCWETGHDCVPGKYPFCCPQQECLPVAGPRGRTVHECRLPPADTTESE